MSHTELRNPLWSAELSKSQKEKTLRNILKGQESENATYKWIVGKFSEAAYKAYIKA